MSTQETMMKTLNQTLRTILLALAFIGTATTADAYDFVVKGIYYNINGDEATVTYMNHYTEHSVSDYYTIYDRYENDNTGHVIIPEKVTYNGKTYTVTEIGEHAFRHYNSEGIDGITLPNTIKIIGDYAFYGCNRLTELTIPDSVNSIGKYAFYYCNGLSVVSISDAVTSIGDFAFQYCSSLRNIVIPNAVISIGGGAFQYCLNMTSITIGKSVTSIGSNGFNSCSQLKTVNCLGDVPPTVSSSNFFSDYTTPKLYVPLASVDAYRTTYGWNYFTDVRGFGENYFSISDITTLQGDTIVIPVLMENVDDITAFQTDIYLPDGFELLKDGEEYMVSLSERKGRDHVIMTNDMPDGSVRVLSYSPSLKTFKNNEGELFYLTVKVPDEFEGKYQLELNNTIVTTLDEEEIHALNALNDISVVSFIMILGDVDASGAITVADIVQTARYILNYNPEPFIFDAADINGDGKITITDVVKIAHMVLDADYGEPTKRLTSGSNSGDRMGGEMNQQSVAITLDNEQEYTAFQLDLNLPEGMTASDYALTERANELGLIVKDRGNGKIRVLGYTADLKTVKENEGALLTFNVTGAGEILVDNIQLVTPEGQTVQLDSLFIGANNMTSVNELDSAKAVASVDYFNLTGQRIERPENGVTLVITTYTDGTRTTTKVIK